VIELPSYERAKAICCRFWSIAPPQYDAWCESGDIAIEDVRELLVLLAHEHVTSEGVFRYAFPDHFAAEDAKAKRRGELINAARGVASMPARTAAQKEKKKRLQEELRRSWEQLKT
jgi:hypothetical protein